MVTSVSHPDVWNRAVRSRDDIYNGDRAQNREWEIVTLLQAIL